MADIRQLITNFYQTRFYETYDVAGNNLCRPALQALKENLPPEQYFGYKQLDQATQTIIALLSEEELRESTPEDEEFLSHYAKLAGNPRIPSKYRIAMYELLLIGHDKYIGSNLQYLEILSKKIKLIPKGENDALRRISFQAAQHARGVPTALKRRIYEQICRKITDYSNFPHMESINQLKKEEKEQAKQNKIINARAQYAQLEKDLTNPKLTTHERIENLLRQEKLLNDCKLGRSKTFDTKARIYRRLQELYCYTIDTETAEYYGLEARRYLALAANARKYSKIRRESTHS